MSPVPLPPYLIAHPALLLLIGVGLVVALALALGLYFRSKDQPRPGRFYVVKVKPTCPTCGSGGTWTIEWLDANEEIHRVPREYPTEAEATNTCDLMNQINLRMQS